MAMLSTEALILRRHRFSESSLVASALTRDFGRVDFLAKGCLRKKSPLLGHLDLYQRESVLIIERPQAGLDLLVEAAFGDEHPGLRFFPPAFAAAGFLAELTLAACMPADPHPGLFDNLSAGFRFLSALGEPAARAGLAPGSGMGRRDKILLTGKVLRRLILQTLTWFGFVPEFGRCVVCGRIPPPSGNALSRRHGGLVCASCRPRAGGGRIGENALDVLRGDVSGRDGGEIGLSEKERCGLLRFLVDYSQYAVERQLRSAGVLFQMLRG